MLIKHKFLVDTSRFTWQIGLQIRVCPVQQYLHKVPTIMQASI